MNNKQVAHVWANQSRPSAKGSSFYFEGDTIYSYGLHFPIARHFKGVVLFTTGSYSVTTSKHIGYARQACSHLTVFHVGDPTKAPCKEHVQGYADRIKTAKATLAKARKKEWPLKALQDLIQEANSFCERFGFKTRFELPSETELETLKAQIQAQSKKDAKARKVKAERIERENAELIQRWLAGESVSVPYQVNRVLLRVRTFNGGGEPHLETSRGAIVTLSEAQKAFRFALLKREKGWHRNGDQFAVGDFQLDAVNEFGVVAGCHRIDWQEIERFGKAMGWLS